MIQIRKTAPDELALILQAELDAFSGDPEIKTLVSDLFEDESAKPLISLLATDGVQPVGHVYFTHVTIEKAQHDVNAMILAPLAVAKKYQRQGIGQQLIYRAMDYAREMGVELLFVLGHPAYYPRCGFVPAGEKGFDAPFPIPPENADAWMLVELAEGALLKARSGTVRCAESMMKPEYWRE